MTEDVKAELLRLEADMARMYRELMVQTIQIMKLKDIAYATDLLCREHRRLMGPFTTSKELDEVERIVDECRRV